MKSPDNLTPLELEELSVMVDKLVHECFNNIMGEVKELLEEINEVDEFNKLMREADAQRQARLARREEDKK